MTSRPVLIVGDVQGDVERLREALAPFPEDEVATVFLGDFVQGGEPGAAGGVAAARLARSRRNSVSVLGNHDVLLLCVLEEQRSGTTPAFYRERHGDSARVADIWRNRRGDWADLRELQADPALETWLRSLPLLLKLGDGTLVQHCDDDRYAELGGDVAEVNAAARAMLRRPGGVWDVFPYTVGRHAFDSPARVERHLRHFAATRVVHGHTPHRGDRPQASHGGRVWSFDGCFSRYWAPDEPWDTGPVGATVALLPAFDAA
ncbi:MAG: hypothetical protein NVS3B18_05790 [Candidatus Dormibacteria bacterium]